MNLNRHRSSTLLLILGVMVAFNSFLLWTSSHRPSTIGPPPKGAASAPPAPGQGPSSPIEAALAPAGPVIRPAQIPRQPVGGEYMDVVYLPPYVFATGGTEALAAWRLDTPSGPQGRLHLSAVPGSVVPGRGFRLLAIDSATLAVANEREGITLVDVHDPGHPTVLSRLPMGGAAAEGMARFGERLLVARPGLDLAAVDLKARNAPRIGDVLRGVSHAHDVAVEGGMACVAAGSDGLAVVGLARGGMRLLGRTATDGDARRVAVAGRRAYVALGSAGFDAVDISDPVRPRVFAHVPSPDPVFSVAVHAGYLYAGAWSNLAVYRLPAAGPPHRVYRGRLGFNLPPPLFTGVAVHGNWLVASEWGSIAVAWHDHQGREVAEAEGPAAPFGGTGGVAPDFRLDGLDGKPHRLSNYRGRTVLLVFFSPS